MTAEGNNRCPLSLRRVLESRAFDPAFKSFAVVHLRHHRLRISGQFTAQRFKSSLRSLHYCSNSVCGRGVPVTNSSPAASYHFNEAIGPSNREINHLIDALRKSSCARLHPDRRPYKGTHRGDPTPYRCFHQIYLFEILSKNKDLYESMS